MSHFPSSYFTVGNASVETTETHTGDTNWTAIPGGSTGTITLEAGATYRVSLSAFLTTSQALTDARVRVYDVTGAAEVVSAHTNQTTGDWRTVIRPVSPGAGTREYRLEMAIDGAAQTVTVDYAYVLVERIM
jgi:hypothetical protein